jgi:hypothetical protein
MSLTLSVNNDCTQVDIQGDFIDTFGIAGDPETVSLTVSITHNCGCQSCETAEEYSYTVLGEDVVGDSTPYTLQLSPTEFGQTNDAFLEGVYLLKIRLDNDGTLSEQNICMTVLCDLECSVFDYQLNYPESKIRLWYDALTSATQCDNCECQDACTLYSNILNELTKTPSQNDCGCS